MCWSPALHDFINMKSDRAPTKFTFRTRAVGKSDLPLKRADFDCSVGESGTAFFTLSYLSIAGVIVSDCLSDKDSLPDMFGPDRSKIRTKFEATQANITATLETIEKWSVCSGLRTKISREDPEFADAVKNLGKFPIFTNNSSIVGLFFSTLHNTHGGGARGDVKALLCYDLTVEADEDVAVESKFCYRHVQCSGWIEPSDNGDTQLRCSHCDDKTGACMKMLQRRRGSVAKLSEPEGAAAHAFSTLLMPSLSAGDTEESGVCDSSFQPSFTGDKGTAPAGTSSNASATSSLPIASVTLSASAASCQKSGVTNKPISLMQSPELRKELLQGRNREKDLSGRLKKVEREVKKLQSELEKRCKELELERAAAKGRGKSVLMYDGPETSEVERKEMDWLDTIMGSPEFREYYKQAFPEGSVMNALIVTQLKALRRKKYGSSFRGVVEYEPWIINLAVALYCHLGKTKYTTISGLIGLPNPRWVQEMKARITKDDEIGKLRLSVVNTIIGDAHKRAAEKRVQKLGRHLSKGGRVWSFLWLPCFRQHVCEGGY